MPRIWQRFALLLVLSLPGALAARADEGDEQFARAAADYNQQHWQQACDAFAKLLAANPDHPRVLSAQFFYGESLAQLERWDAARGQFAELLRRDPNHRYARQALFRSAEAAYLGGDKPAAQRDLQAFRKRYADDDLNAYVLPYLASLEQEAGKPVEAELLFAAALEQFSAGPLVDECHLGIAQAHEQLGHLDAARSGYALVANADSPLADRALLALGMIENTQGEHARALATIEHLAARFPNSRFQDKARLGRGYALYRLNRYLEAEPLLTGLANDPSLGVEARYWLGLSQQARGQSSAAATTLLAAGKIDANHPLNAAIGFHAADTLAKAGQSQPADAEFDRVLARWPTGAWADDCLLGKVRLAAERHDDADCTRLADELTSRFPDSPLALDAAAAKGQALFALGKYAEAIEPLAQVLARAPVGGETQNDDLRAQTQAALALGYAKLSRFDESNAAFAALRAAKNHDDLVAETSYHVAEMAFAAGESQVARDIFSKLAEGAGSRDSIRRGLAGLGWCDFKAGRWSDAAHAFEQLLSQSPDDSTAAEAALMRGRSLEHLDQPDSALAMYRVVIDKFPDDARSAEALWRTARLQDERRESQAIELYARLVQDHPDFAQLDAAIYRWAWLVGASGATAQSDELFARLKRDFPHSRFAADATLRLAERALAAQKYDDAKKLLVELIEPPASAAADAPANSSPSPEIRQHALYLTARVAAAAKQWADVDAPLVKLLEEASDGELATQAAYLRAEASYQQGRFDEAVQRLTELAARTKDHPQNWSAAAELRRAQALAQMKQWSEALDIAHGIEASFPSFAEQHEADYLIGRALAAGADFAGAREAYAKVIESPGGGKTQTAAMAQWMIGESYFHQENYAAALAEYAKVDRYSFPRWQSAALLQAGKCHELLGHWRLAVEAYDRLVKTYPASEFAEEAARRSTAIQHRAATEPTKLK